MAEQATTARPYARAAFNSASAANGLAAWSVFLTRAAATVSDERVAALIGSPRVRQSDLAAFVGGIAGADATGGQSNFLRLLVENRRLPLLPQISQQFEALRADAERVADVEVVSARELSDQDASKLKAALEQRLKRSVRLHPRVDPTLVGGAVVRYGDFVVDGSMRGRIDRMAAAMSGG